MANDGVRIFAPANGDGALYGKLDQYKVGQKINDLVYDIKTEFARMKMKFSHPTDVERELFNAESDLNRRNAISRREELAQSPPTPMRPGLPRGGAANSHGGDMKTLAQEQLGQNIRDTDPQLFNEILRTVRDGDAHQSSIKDERMQSVIDRDATFTGRIVNAVMDAAQVLQGMPSIWHEVRDWEVRQEAEQRKLFGQYPNDADAGVPLSEAWEKHELRVDVVADRGIQALLSPQQVADRLAIEVTKDGTPGLALEDGRETARAAELAPNVDHSSEGDRPQRAAGLGR